MRTSVTTLLLLLLSLGLLAQDKVLTLDDYKDWSRISNAAISPDGEWMTYSYVPNEGDTASFFVHKIDGDIVFTSFNARSANFSSDSKWLAFLMEPTKSEKKALRKQKKPIHNALHLYNISNGSTDTIQGVSSYSFAENARYIAIKKAKSSKEAEHSGTDLIIRDLAKGTNSNIGNVSEFAFNEPGDLLAYLVDADGKSGNGIYIKDLSNHRIWPLHTSDHTFSSISWNEDGDKIAALFGDKPDGKMERENTIVWMSDLKPGMSSIGMPNKFESGTSNGFSENFVISEYETPEWNETGTQLYFGINEQEDEIKEDDDEKANVDVWHWKDDIVQSRQMITASRDRRATMLSVLNVANNQYHQLETEDMSYIDASEKSYWAVAEDDVAYRSDLNRPRGYGDLMSIDTRTGESSVIAKDVYYNLGMSPMGDYVVYAMDGKVMLHKMETGETTELTARSDAQFQNLDYDSPVEKPVYGVAGWSSDGEWVMLNSKYDIYAFSLTSDEVINLTQGIGDEGEIRLRMVQLDPEEDRYDITKPLLLRAYGEWTKQSGYYQVSFGDKPKKLRYLDKMLSRPIKAKDADVVIYTEQTFEEFPDFWVSNTSFDEPKKITDANPQIVDYRWGRRVLVDYTDQRGNKLQATLALPAGYEEGKKYPMIIYFYEKVSQRHHAFSMPRYDDRPHMSAYASDGYLVLMPDIVYTEGKPGSSALDDITSATQKVIDLGYADPDRIGLQGHSWGGYQSSFIVTQTDMFACVVTGAPLTNLISMNNIPYKASGHLNGPILQWSQGRMGVTPWEDMDLWVSQSPIHHAEKITTPFLILHGTADGAVDWLQGLEYYATARRLGKEVILLSYPDEPHHLQVEANQKDFQTRMKQYFDYYLKDVAPPKWITDGVKHLDKKKADLMEK